jgi:Tetratricopeptide repeat/Protein of unknown function (DUF2914)
MAETREVRSALEAAEQAAAVSDYESAERFLREAASLQEATLGPNHPGLANTLNNLAIVCEITEKPIEAERYFRRAWAIATAVLDADDPFVATSRKNLEDFCASRGLAVDPPTPLPPVAADQKESGATSFEPAQERSADDEPRPDSSTNWHRPVAIGALIAGLLLIFAWTSPWFRDGADSSAASGSVSAPPDPATTAPSPPVDPIPMNAPKESPSMPAATERDTPAPSPRQSSGQASLRPVRVVTAQLCSDFSTGARGSNDWQCVPARPPVGPGVLFFYTRLESPTDATVQHRWYRGDRLRQAVELPIRANTTGGYRTFSRNTINNLGAAEWRVELRTEDGVLLHEERFAVQ